MKNYLPIMVLIASVLVTAQTTACKKSDKVHVNNAIILNGNNSVINTCGWVIQLNDVAEITHHNSLKPVNLDPQFQNEGMQVKIVYTIPDMPVARCGTDAGYTQINILNVTPLN